MRYTLPICTLFVVVSAVAAQDTELDGFGLLVTSDAPNTHVVTPGVSTFDVDHDGVGYLSIGSTRCTAALLEQGGRQFALTGAHCIVDDSLQPRGATASVRFDTPQGPVTRSSSTFHVHPFYSGDVFDGYDIALIEFATPPPPEVAAYQLYRGTDLREVGVEHVRVGYGARRLRRHRSHFSLGVERGGLNEWETRGLGLLGVAGITNNDTHLTYDFDSGAVGEDAFHFHLGFAENLGLGDDEVMAASGDSGSPVFIDDGGTPRIAGVTSYGFRLETGSGGSSDVDGVFNASWGEFGADARIANSLILGFIDGLTVPGGQAVAGRFGP